MAQAAASSLDTMIEGTSFQSVLEDAAPNHSASRVVLCSGKHYYTLSDHFAKSSSDDVALVRVEELSPFPREN